MNRLSYFIKKQFYKRVERRNAEKLLNDEMLFRERYKGENNASGRIKVCTYQTGYARHFTRFYTSANRSNYCFYIVDDPREADVVVFINTIDSTVVSRGQKVVFFFHEPKDYAHLYQTTIDWDRIEDKKLQVISHLPIEDFITNPHKVAHHRSIPYVHFHHMATCEELKTLDGIERKKQICSITSGFSGIPGYQKRRDFILKLSRSNREFDLFGKFSKESSALAPYRGPCLTKWETLKEYRYNLVIENSDDEYYISEKIFDALICGCMPIYYGNAKIFEVIPKEWFYYLPTLEEAEIGKLNEFLKTDSYRIVADNRAKIAEVIYSKYSFYQALDDLLQDRSLALVPDIQ